jgi:tetratricopeptide (TPR) repeat protein
MRAFVFTDQSLKRQAGRYVWLELNTENAVNAPFRKKLPWEALPSFFIVDPADEHVALRWVGGMTLAQLDKILDDGTIAVATGGKHRPKKDPMKVNGGISEAANQSFVAAEAAYGKGDNAEAAKKYLEAIHLAPEGWSHYARAVESALFALQSTNGYADGARLALDAYPRVKHSVSGLNVAATGLDCASSLDSTVSEKKEMIYMLERDTREALADTTYPAAADDRSGAYIVLLDTRKNANDEKGAHDVALAWSRFLDRQAARAKSPPERMVFDPHRLSAYIEIGEPERAIPMLERSRKDAPDDYNPYARLAIAYKAMKKWDEALAASDQAIAKCEGPRKLTIFNTRVDIFLGRNDREGAKKTLADELAYAESLPQGQKSDRTISSLKKRIESMETAP